MAAGLFLVLPFFAAPRPASAQTSQASKVGADRGLEIGLNWFKQQATAEPARAWKDAWTGRAWVAKEGRLAIDLPQVSLVLLESSR